MCHCLLEKRSTLGPKMRVLKFQNKMCVQDIELNPGETEYVENSV